VDLDIFVTIVILMLQPKIGDIIKYAYFSVPVYNGNGDFRMSEHFGVVLDRAAELLYVVYSFTDEREYRIIKDDILCIVS
jgi:hypothetical protein